MVSVHGVTAHLVGSIPSCRQFYRLSVRAHSVDDVRERLQAVSPHLEHGY